MIAFLSRSVARKILAAFIAIYVVTYVSTALVVYSNVRSSVVESNTNALNRLADLKFVRLASTVDALATDVTAWSELEVMNDLVSGDIDKRVVRTLEGLKQLYSLSGDLYAFDADGKLIASTRPARAAVEIAALPEAWRNQANRLVFLGKHPDPATGVPIIALDVPVMGSFDRSYRIGTLVLAYPWSAIENMVFDNEARTILVERGDPPILLATDMPGALGSSVTSDQASTKVTIGRSTARNGLLQGWQVRTLQETSALTRSLTHVGIELALLGLILAIPIVGLGRWLSNRLTAPVMDLTRVVRKIAETDMLNARVPVSSSDELGTLARAFNHMTESLAVASRERESFVRDLEALNATLETKVARRTKELEAAVAAQQRLIGDISHEIKSPLARLGVALGLARRSSEDDSSKHFDRMQREVDNISALASELLMLARLDGAAAAFEFDPVDVSALIRQIADDALYESPERKDDLKVTGATAPVVVDANPDLLRRAIENVVRNALFYTTIRTAVEIVLLRTEPGRVAIEVHDLGPGVPDAALAHLFEPFYRVDEARARKTGGAGIGLAICRRIIDLHRGTARACANRPNGLMVQMEIPVSQPGK